MANTTINIFGSSGEAMVGTDTINTLLAGKQDVLTFDNEPTDGSNNPVKSGGIKTALDAKADAVTTYSKSDVDDAIDDKLTHVTVAAVSGDVSFFVRDNALCISTENFTTVSAAPSISTAIQADGTCLVTITDNSDGGNAEIRYSTDGSTPSTVYTQPFSIETAGTFTIKATAQEDGKPVSNVTTATATVSQSGTPTITTEKTSSDMTITATGSGTVTLKVGGSTVANPYTVSRTSSNQSLSVEVTNKEANKLATVVTQTIVVPKLTIVSVKIRNFVKRVVDDGGHLIFGEPASFDWSTVTSSDWAEGYDDTTDPSNPTFDQTQVTNSDLLGALEETQEAYDAHTILLGIEPELDFLGYKGTRIAPTYLYSVNSNCDADVLSDVYINNGGLLVASVSHAEKSNTGANIKWTKYPNVYSTRFAPDITYDGTSRTVNRDFKRLYIKAEDGFLNPTHSGTSGYVNTIISGFPNSEGGQGCVCQESDMMFIAREQRNKILNTPRASTGMTELFVKVDSPTELLVNGESPEQVSVEYDLWGSSRTWIGVTYMQMKANSPTLILLY